MKEIFEKLRDASKDERLTDAAFRRVVQDTFDRRQHNETIVTSFLRAYDLARSREQTR